MRGCLTYIYIYTGCLTAIFHIGIQFRVHTSPMCRQEKHTAASHQPWRCPKLWSFVEGRALRGIDSAAKSISCLAVLGPAGPSDELLPANKVASHSSRQDPICPFTTDKTPGVSSLTLVYLCRHVDIEASTDDIFTLKTLKTSLNNCILYI